MGDVGNDRPADGRPGKDGPGLGGVKVRPPTEGKLLGRAVLRCIFCSHFLLSASWRSIIRPSLHLKPRNLGASPDGLRCLRELSVLIALRRPHY